MNLARLDTFTTYLNAHRAARSLFADTFGGTIWSHLRSSSPRFIRQARNEMVCEDRAAKGHSLNEKLGDLASRQEIPTKLVAVATKLRHFGNVAAHAGLGELTTEEIPILDDLTCAILEYVYSAPHLVDQADKRLQALKSKSGKKKKGA